VDRRTSYAKLIEGSACIASLRSPFGQPLGGYLPFRQSSTRFASVLAHFFEVAAKPQREDADRSVRAPPDGLGLRMILLEGADLDLASLQGFDGSEGGVGAADRE
jgi:hypothetical protein